MSVMTVQGKLDAGALGVVPPHEHVLIDIRNQFTGFTAAARRALSEEPVGLSNLDVLSRNPYALRDNLVLNDPAVAEQELMRFKRAGGDSVVDATSIGVGRDPEALTFCVAAPAYVTDGSEAHLAHAREQCRWFGGMVGNHVADIVARYGETAPVPKELTDYIKGREGYDYNQHGQAGNVHAAFVPDSIVDRFCVIGPVDEQARHLIELKELGVDQFAIYLQHDAKDETLQAYGERVMPAIVDQVLAKS